MDRVLSMLGLAARGRNVVRGEFQTESAVKTGQAMVVLVAEDASKNTKKLFLDKCSFYEVPVYIYGTKESLGRAIGRQERSSVGVTNEGLAESVKKNLEAMSIKQADKSVLSEK